MKALVGAFNQEKALVGAFSVIVQPVVEPMEYYTALILSSLMKLPGRDVGVWPRAQQLSRHGLCGVCTKCQNKAVRQGWVVCVQRVIINNKAQCCVSVPCRGWGQHYADGCQCGAGPGWAAQRVPANLLLVPGSCLTSAPATLTTPHLAPLRGHLLCVCIR